MFTLDLPEDVKKLLDVYEKTYAQYSRRMEPYMKAMEQLGKMFQEIHEQTRPYMQAFQTVSKLLSGLHERMTQSFNESLDLLEKPERYKSKKVRIPKLVHKLALDGAVSIDEDIGKQPFSYLRGRLQVALAAHMRHQYHLSILSLLSVIDGILTWFYKKETGRTKYPHFNEKLDRFFSVYKFDKFLKAKKMRRKFDMFILHRNQIMHGGKYAHFDRNISTIAMLFLVIVYHSVTQKQE